MQPDCCTARLKLPLMQRFLAILTLATRYRLTALGYPPHSSAVMAIMNRPVFLRCPPPSSSLPVLRLTMVSVMNRWVLMGNPPPLSAHPVLGIMAETMAEWVAPWKSSGVAVHSRTGCDVYLVGLLTVPYSSLFLTGLLTFPYSCLSLTSLLTVPCSSLYLIGLLTVPYSSLSLTGLLTVPCSSLSLTGLLTVPCSSLSLTGLLTVPYSSLSLTGLLTAPYSSLSLIGLLTVPYSKHTWWWCSVSCFTLFHGLFLSSDVSCTGLIVSFFIDVMCLGLVWCFVLL